MPTSLQGIAKKAARHKTHRFHNLFGLLRVVFLLGCWRWLNKRAAPGVDRIRAWEYGKHLREHVGDLAERVQTERYRAKLVRRQYIPKGQGKLRPLGIPAIEDKLLQTAVAQILEAIYEQDFRPCSYGYRRAVGALDAVRDLTRTLQFGPYGFIVEADIKGCFDSIERTRLREVLRQRVNDGSILRLMGKWLRAGVMEDEILRYPEIGVVQGGVSAPVLANIFLHHGRDEWFEQEVQPRMQGRCFLMRFADDFVIGCESEADARRIMDVLPKRFARYGLTIHPTKTTLIAFRKPAARQGSADGSGTFDFLGLTHYWTKSRRGFWVIKRRTARKRLRRTKKSLWRWCRLNRHAPLKYQYQQLCQK